MPLDLHGVEVVELLVGGRAIPTANVSIVGCVGVAETADAAAFPLSTPVLIAGSRDEKRAMLGMPGADDTRQRDVVTPAELAWQGYEVRSGWQGFTPIEST